MRARINEDAPVTAADAARYFALTGASVTRVMVHMWIARAQERGTPIPVVDRGGPRNAPRYRLGALLEAERAARENDTGRGRARSAA